MPERSRPAERDVAARGTEKPTERPGTSSRPRHASAEGQPDDSYWEELDRWVWAEAGKGKPPAADVDDEIDDDDDDEVDEVMEADDVEADDVEEVEAADESETEKRVDDVEDAGVADVAVAVAAVRKVPLVNANPHRYPHQMMMTTTMKMMI